MPLAGTIDEAPVDPSFFHSLDELDNWASKPAQKHGNLLPFIPRKGSEETKGRLLVTHDYKGGYNESSFSLGYTFNFWSYCSTFIYFSHHRVTIPPPGWINAAHRHGVKMLGTLIFEDGGGPDALRLLVGQLPRSSTGPASQTTTQLSLPLSSHYSRILTNLAVQRGFDGYLLNFEVPLQGSIEQTRALAAWISILQTELKATVGPHAEVIWYDSVIVNGTLAWQDRLNSLNLPFFLSSTALFTNYTWPNNYPNDTASYFTSLDESLIGPKSHVGKKSLNDIYVGVDVWGRGSHGNGGFGCYKAINHIDPTSLGLSVALFAPAWTWESEQDKRGFSWDTWWDYERKFWVGNPGGPSDVKDIKPPKFIMKKGEPNCSHGSFQPIAAFFKREPAPDPYDLPFHSTFSPGVGRCWWVNGLLKYRSENGWTDIDKQTSIGDLCWPKPQIEWEVAEPEPEPEPTTTTTTEGEASGEGDEEASTEKKVTPPAKPKVAPPKDLPLPDISSSLSMDEAWNGGNSLKLTLTYPSSKLSSIPDLQSLFIPVQSLSITPGNSYTCVIILRPDTPDTELADNLDISIGVKVLDDEFTKVEVEHPKEEHEELTDHWTRIYARFTVPTTSTSREVALGLVVTAVLTDHSKARTLPISIGQMNAYPTLPEGASDHLPMLLWADWHLFTEGLSEEEKKKLAEDKDKNHPAGTLTYETAASLPILPALPADLQPGEPKLAWSLNPSFCEEERKGGWFPNLIYANIYALHHPGPGRPLGGPQNARWIGTSGSAGDGRRNTFVVMLENLPFYNPDSSSSFGDSSGGGKKKRMVRFYVQGVTDRGEVLDWDKCVFVDAALDE